MSEISQVISVITITVILLIFFILLFFYRYRDPNLAITRADFAFTNIPSTFIEQKGVYDLEAMKTELSKQTQVLDEWQKKDQSQIKKEIETLEVELEKDQQKVAALGEEYDKLQEEYRQL